jgi:hypothetical protein
LYIPPLLSWVPFHPSSSSRDPPTGIFSVLYIPISLYNYKFRDHACFAAVS